MSPRLTQPLFAGAQAKAKQSEDQTLYHLVRAYDAIWSLVYKPDDMRPEDRISNARANLIMLSDLLEQALGTEAFESDPRQLSFPEEIVHPMQAILGPLKPDPLTTLQLNVSKLANQLPAKGQDKGE